MAKVDYSKSPALNIISAQEQAAPTTSGKALRSQRKQLILTEELAEKARKEAFKREQSFNSFVIDLLEAYFSKQAGSNE